MRKFGTVREIASLDLPNAPHLDNFPIKVHPLGTRVHQTKVLGNFLAHYRHSPKLVPWLRENVEKYDCVIVNGLWNYSAFAASRVLPGLRTPYFVYAHGMMDPWFRKAYPLKHLLKQLFWLFCEGPLLANARSVFFTTEEEMVLARGVFWGYSYREKVVGYGIGDVPTAGPESRAALVEKVPALGSRRFLLYLSRIDPKKGCDLLIRAFAKVAQREPDLDLVIAGPDQTGLVAKLVKDTQKLGIADRVHWPGMLKGEAKWGAYYSAEAFILPSHQENFGIVVAEALACGKPVLISNKINIWREIEHLHAGIVADDTLAGTSEMLVRFLGLSADERRTMERAAKVCYRRHFNIQTSASLLYTTLREAVGVE